MIGAIIRRKNVMTLLLVEKNHLKSLQREKKVDPIMPIKNLIRFKCYTVNKVKISN